MTAYHVSVDTVPYRPTGRYVCDWDCTEAHLFDTGKEAKAFAKAWGRDCDVGWLAPILQNGRNAKPRAHEAQKQISQRVKIVDHRK